MENLTKCPRCGFSQPDDQYCASCGVNMESFRKKHQPSILKMISSDSRFQLFALFALILAVLISTNKKALQSIESQWAVLKNPIQIASSENLIAQQRTIQSTDNAKPVTANLKEPAANSSLEKAEASTSSNTGAGEANISKNEITIYYAEVPKKNFLEIMEETQNSQQYIDFDDYQAGVIGDIEKKILNKEIIVLATEKKSFAYNQLLTWFIGEAPSTEIPIRKGLEHFIEIQNTNTTLKFNLEVQRIWKETPTTPPVKRPFPASFEITEENVVFMSGLFPRRFMQPDEGGLLKVPEFKILTSPHFNQGRSEFVIFYKITR